MAAYDDFAALEKRGWADADTAAAYAKDFARASEMAVPALVAESATGPGKHVLDLCCGQGIVARGLLDAGAKVSGLDFSPAMLAIARGRAPEAEFIEGDAMDLPFDDGHFDAVAMGFGMPHVPDPPAVMAEVRRVLKPGGRFAYSVWLAAERSAFTYVFAAIGAHGAPEVTLPPGPGATDYGEEDRAFSAMTAAGFGTLRAKEVDSRWTIDDPGAPFDFFVEGTVRGAAMLRPQPDANKRAIRAAVVDKVLANHGETAPFDTPIPSVVISGTAV